MALSQVRSSGVRSLHGTACPEAPPDTALWSSRFGHQHWALEHLVRLPHQCAHITCNCVLLEISSVLCNCSYTSCRGSLCSRGLLCHKSQVSDWMESIWSLLEHVDTPFNVAQFNFFPNLTLNSKDSKLIVSLLDHFPFGFFLLFHLVFKSIASKKTLNGGFILKPS